jgi:hypothetical protein
VLEWLLGSGRQPSNGDLVTVFPKIGVRSEAATSAVWRVDALCRAVLTIARRGLSGRAVALVKQDQVNTDEAAYNVSHHEVAT